jgi:hypothetical protein
MEQTYRSQILDHLGLVAGMFDELGIGEVVDKATQQNPEMRDLTVGEAVKAMVLNGLGFVNHALSLVSNSNFDFAKGSWLSIDTDFAKVEISRAPRRQR